MNIITHGLRGGPVALPDEVCATAARSPMGTLQFPFQFLDLSYVASHSDEFVTLFVYEELAHGALEALPTQPPYPVVAVSAKGSLQMNRFTLNSFI